MATSLSRTRIKNLEEETFKVYWSGAWASLFIYVDEDGWASVLDYENDSTEIISVAGGGHTTYSSSTGLTGEGVIKKVSALIPVGGYRVDTKSPFIWAEEPICAGGGYVSIFAPYTSHMTAAEKDRLLSKNPIIVRHTDYYGKISLMCYHISEIRKALLDILQGKLPDSVVKEETTELYDGEGRSYDRLSIKFLTKFWGHESPWNFIELDSGNESLALKVDNLSRLERLFRCRIDPEGVYLTKYVGGELFRTDKLALDPFKDEGTFQSSFSKLGWVYCGEGLAHRHNNRTLQHEIVCWGSVKQVLKHQLEHLEKTAGEPAVEEVLGLFYERDQEHVEYEIAVSEQLWMLGRKEFLLQAREGLKQKLQEELLHAIEACKRQRSDKELIDSLPDDAVITFDDSISAGNCEPGTRAFAEEFFGGATKTTAGELKKYASRGDVARVLRYVALHRAS